MSDVDKWIETRSGESVSLIAPGENMIHLEDIAHGLAHTCRFGGQCAQFYSVAEHSIIVANHYAETITDDFFNARTMFAMIMHDAAEAYIGDVTSPLKALLPDYRQIEARISAAIASRFDVDQSPYTTAQIERCDRQVLALEKIKVMRSSRDWSMLTGVIPATISPMFYPPELAASEFLSLARHWMVKSGAGG